VIDADSINANRVFDSAGNYHGELTGTNDAQTVIDALADRPSEAALVLPDPGFRLDWEQQVDLPAAEPSFSLLTVGRPRLEVRTGFSGSVALRKPPSATGGPQQLQRYYIGPIEIINRGDTTTLDWGIELSDAKQSVIDRPVVRSAPGVHIATVNSPATLNRIVNPQLDFTGTTPGIRLDECYATLVEAPSFNGRNAQANDNPTTAYYAVGGNWNKWLNTHIERAGTGFLLDDEQWYTVTENDWDRLNSFRWTVKEENGSFGWIDLTRPRNARAIRLCSPLTDLSSSGDSEERSRSFRDFTDRLSTATFADSINANSGTIGVLDASPGGGSASVSLSVGPNSTIDIDSGSSERAKASLGGPVMSTTNHSPKLFASIGPDTASDLSGVRATVQVGQNANNNARLEYDESGNGAWVFILEENGSIVNTVENTGVTPTAGETQSLSIQHEYYKDPDGSSSEVWSAHIDGTLVAERAGSMAIGAAGVQVDINPLNGTTKSWTWDIERANRFLAC
jgi:hypothetical protein